MGTRNLTMVIKNKQTKVAQYGQWDGYPEGVGSCILEFLKNKDLLDKFVSKLDNVRFLTDSDSDKEFLENYNKNAPNWSSEPDLRTEEQKRWFSLYTTRNLAEGVMVNIANSEPDEEILLTDSTSFAGDGLMCEWAYVIDLDNNTFEVYEGFGKGSLTEDERFYHLTEENNEYSPVKLVAKFDIDNLPTDEEFLKEFSSEETEEEAE